MGFFLIQIIVMILILVDDLIILTCHFLMRSVNKFFGTEVFFIPDSILFDFDIPYRKE